MRTVVGLLAVGLFLVGCTQSNDAQLVEANVVEILSGAVDDGFARAVDPIEFSFPADHGSHGEYQTEWWYYTGNLSGENGADFGFQLTFFRQRAGTGTAASRVFLRHRSSLYGPFRAYRCVCKAT